MSVQSPDVILKLCAQIKSDGGPQYALALVAELERLRGSRAAVLDVSGGVPSPSAIDARAAAREAAPEEPRHWTAGDIIAPANALAALLGRQVSAEEMVRVVLNEAIRDGLVEEPRGAREAAPSEAAIRAAREIVANCQHTHSPLDGEFDTYVCEACVAAGVRAAYAVDFGARSPLQGEGDPNG